MNKAEQEVARTQLSSEQKALKELEAVYRKARQDCEDKIAELNSRTDMENLQSVVYQKKYQQVILNQINQSISALHFEQYKTVEDFLQDSYDNGWIGSMYDLQQQGIPLTIPIDDRKVVKALSIDSQLSSSYYKSDPIRGRLEENVDLLKDRIRSNVSRGIVAGKSWLQVAEDIATGMNNPFEIALRDAMRIVRTEGHRINQQAFVDAGDEAVKKGADIVKQWDATLDGKTRPWHMEADGQIREWDEPFLVMGEELTAPAIGGSAKNVVNCRCQLLQRARWALDEEELKTLEDRAKFFGLDKTKDFEDFKQKFLNLPANADSIDVKNPLGFKTIQGEHSLADDLKNTNPNYKVDKSFRVNCQRCVPTWEMRMRGYDVEALPQLGDKEPRDGAYYKWKKIFDGAVWEKDLGGRNSTVKKKIVEMVQSWGDGARGEIYCAWKSGSAHVFGVINEGGMVRFVDGQNGSMNANRYFDNMRPSYTQIARIDNLEPNETLIKQCCKNVGD